MAANRTALNLVSSTDTTEKVEHKSPRTLFQSAYERIEGLIVNCEVRPGSSLSIKELQNISGFGRTPLHQAVNRLADDTLITILPRQGLRIAPIDLARERTLLRVRGDLERFVVQLATKRAQANHRNQMFHMCRLLSERRDTLTIDDFNVFDRRIDQLILSAAAEPFLEHTLRPLHTIFRRIGWIYHTQLATRKGLSETIDGHLAILIAVANQREDQAVQVTNGLVEFVETMFDALEVEADPALLDSSLTLPI